MTISKQTCTLFERLIKIGAIHEKEGGKPEAIIKRATENIEFVCEKRIKGIFNRYRTAVKCSEINLADDDTRIAGR